MLERLPVVLTVLFGLFAATGGLWVLTQEVPAFFDPCHAWDVGEGPHTTRLTDDCPTQSGTSETKAQAALRLTMMQGGWLATAVLVLAGTALARPWTFVVSGVVWLAQGYWAMLSVGVFFALPAAVAFWGAWCIGRPARRDVDRRDARDDDRPA